MEDGDLRLRRAIFEAFAATGEPPAAEDGATLRALAEQHVVVLDADGRIEMAHPFAAHDRGARVDAGGGSWRGSCAWDAFGIVAALGLREATLTAQGLTLGVHEEGVEGDAVFHVLVPAAHWWDDIAFT